MLSAICALPIKYSRFFLATPPRILSTTYTPTGCTSVSHVFKPLSTRSSSPSELAFTKNHFQSLYDSIEQVQRTIHGKLKSLNAFEKHSELSKLVQNPTFWDEPKKASRLAREHAQLEEQINRSNDLIVKSGNLLELAALAIDENHRLSEPDEENLQILQECESELTALLKSAQRILVDTLLDGPADKCGCFIEVNAGAGGTESCEFSLMLLTMYQQYALKMKYLAEIIESQPGQEAGIRNGLLRIVGDNVYGWLKNESGVHRLVRISPYDTQQRRQTCFSQVVVTPIPTDDQVEINVDVPSTELRIDTYRSSGPGGQHANVTDSAVRITHIPTGIVAQSQSGRSQHKNKAQAMEILKARLLEKRINEKKEELNAYKDGIGDNSWGNQMRSYILHPYQLVKDHRTGHETTQTESVLAGDPEYIGPFLEATLLKVD